MQNPNDRNPGWQSPQKPAEYAEQRLIDAILDGRFPVGSSLPAERELAAQLGVTRPTLRETLQRLERDGWLEIRHGKPTRVRNYWTEGNLAVLSAIARRPAHLPADFIDNLLAVRLLLAPAYTRLAVQNVPAELESVLAGYVDLPDAEEAFARFDWQLHHALSTGSGNPIFTLILNGFSDLSMPISCIYFRSPHSRVNSRAFYGDLLAAVRARNAVAAEEITRQVMRDSLALWQAARFQA